MSEHVYSGSKQTAPTGLPVIKCECGQKILLVPDPKIMGQCIDAHVAFHRQKIADQKKAQVEADRIRDFLVSQVLKKASEQQTKRNR
ncbi:MAG: hypothetical protein ACBZ72_04995 [Candidatus Bathyarchaeia archaeon]|jgi:hypothetical protein